MTTSTEKLLADMESVAEMRRQIYDDEQNHIADRDEILRPIHKKLDRLQQRFDEDMKPKLDRLAKLEERVKVAVIARGNTVKHAGVMAMFVKPRENWDAKKLEGFALAYPAILGAKTTAETGTCQLRNYDEK